MIPWFIANMADHVASWFGYHAYVTAQSGNRWGCERIHFVYNPLARRLPKLKARG